MLVKAVFIIILILFSLLSFFINLPPGNLITQAANIPTPYLNLLSNNILNGVFYGAIIALVVYLGKRSSKPKYLKYSPKKSRFDYEIESTYGNDQKMKVESNLTKIKGIGPKRALELEFAGVKTISDLAKRSPKHLAEKTNIPITQISKWIIEANKQTK
jgi:hypothetical protein